MAKLRSKGKRTAFGGPTKANSVANNVNAKAGTPKSVKINEKKTGDNREVQKEEKVENTPTTELDNKVENAAEEGSDKKVEQTPKPNKNKKRLRKKKKISAEHPAAASKDVSLPETSAAKKDPKKDNIMGLIFMCNAQTKKECFQHKILGLPASKKDIVAKVFKGMKLFLFDIDLRLMYGIYKASSPGGYDIKPKAFKSAFPSQVRFEVWDDCLPLPEERFKGAIKENYFARNKFDCVLTAKQVKDLTKLFKPARDSKRDGRVHQTMIPRSTDRYSKRERDNNRTRFSPVNDDRRRRARREVYYREADREAYQSLPLHPSLPPPLPQYLPAALPQYLPAVLPHAYERLPPPQIDYYRVDPQLELRNHQLGALRRDPPLELRDRQLQDWQRDPQLELHDPPLRDMQLEPQLVRRDRQLMALHQEPQPEYHIRQVAPPLDNSNSRFADLHRDSQLELREQVMLRNLQREPQLDLYDHQGLDLQLRPQDRIGLQSSYISQRNVMPYHDSLFSAGLSQDYNRNGYY